MNKDSKTGPSALSSPVCHFANVEYKGQKGMLLLENPRGDSLKVENLLEQVGAFTFFFVDTMHISLRAAFNHYHS